jgi:hypothetical protein
MTGENEEKPKSKTVKDAFIDAYNFFVPKKKAIDTAKKELTKEEKEKLMEDVFDTTNAKEKN